MKPQRQYPPCGTFPRRLCKILPFCWSQRKVGFLVSVSPGLHVRGSRSIGQRRDCYLLRRFSFVGQSARPSRLSCCSATCDRNTKKWQSGAARSDHSKGESRRSTRIAGSRSRICTSVRPSCHWKPYSHRHYHRTRPLCPRS